MTLDTTSAPVPAASGAAEPVWFASYPPGIPKKFEEYDEPCLPSGINRVEEIERWHSSTHANRVLNCESDTAIRNYWMHALSKS